MKDIITPFFELKELGKKAALATVLKTWGSSPRQAGAHMLIAENGEFFGSVSGGCVEVAVVEEALSVLETGKARKLRFGVADDTAWDVGLACGGEIEIFLSPINWNSISPILSTINSGDPCWYQINLDDEGTIEIKEKIANKFALPYLDQTTSPEKLYLFIPAEPELIIIGGVNISQHLVGFSKLMGYKTTLIDPRKGFSNRNRFPDIDNILNLWPEEAFKKITVSTNTAIVILTHDDKIDVPALILALRSPAFYIGALGSKKTQSRRNNALLKLGFSDVTLNKIHGPIGLDIGAKEPSEIALAIMAEITAASKKFWFD